MPSTLVWLRRDLRLHDHSALELATRTSEQVWVAFVYDTQILDMLPDRADRRLQFIQTSLDEVHAGLQAAGSGLLTGHGDPVELIPALARALAVDRVITAHDDDPYALRRDAEVRARLHADGRGWESVCDHVIRERRQVLTGGGDPFRVFTPYSRAWRQSVSEGEFIPRTPDLSALGPVPAAMPAPWRAGNHGLEEMGFQPTDLWLEPGARAGQARLAEFSPRIARYEEERNFPAIPATSGLSVHLRFGTVSIRECFRAARQSGAAGIKWETELIWREFYHMILACFPHVVGGAFRPEYNSLKWEGKEAHFEAWCQGRTGFPLVDAAMRCLNATGWMHNRLRMVTAMFLTKDLLIDWRKGEQYFADKLLDFELASNNGGWQWSSSTGVDAQPYFRVFNPLLQSQKFDPEGKFIREWCPELNHLDNKAIHWPFTEDGLATLDTPNDYPMPIVLHREQKDRAIAMFKVGK